MPSTYEVGAGWVYVGAADVGCEQEPGPEGCCGAGRENDCIFDWGEKQTDGCCGDGCRVQVCGREKDSVVARVADARVASKVAVVATPVRIAPPPSKLSTTELGEGF
jgi:hypothetical protein